MPAYIGLLICCNVVTCNVTYIRSRDPLPLFSLSASVLSSKCLSARSMLASGRYNRYRVMGAKAVAVRLYDSRQALARTLPTLQTGAPGRWNGLRAPRLHVYPMSEVWAFWSMPTKILYQGAYDERFLAEHRRGAGPGPTRIILIIPQPRDVAGE
jgi:hypothetical protein